MQKKVLKSLKDVKLVDLQEEIDLQNNKNNKKEVQEMSSKKKTKAPEVMPDQILNTPEEIIETEQRSAPIDTPETDAPAGPAPEVNSPKYPVGSIVFVAKETSADLNGFKLFPQYKKYTYTVEAYDAEKSIYSLRRLNLSLKLKEADIVAPNEKHDNPLIRRQY